MGLGFMNYVENLGVWFGLRVEGLGFMLRMSGVWGFGLRV